MRRGVEFLNKLLPISVPGIQGVIFPAELVPRNLFGYGEPWTPSTEQVLDAESRLPEFLARATPVTPASVLPGAAQRIAARLDCYARQYIGVSLAGSHLVHINCFLPDNRTEWRSQPVDVDDGGETFFHVLYDPASREFCGLSVNGEA